ncbi:MAG: helix-turn-helix transcriptional regulator [Clostridiaceae bacterium]|nr:helix-turn-helix transcriptional regulator [Clostridiaceae bacterium]
MLWYPSHHLNQKRIEESKRLLETTNFSVLQIASIVGFSSQSYFSQTFKKAVGQTPLEYRKEMLEKSKR